MRRPRSGRLPFVGFLVFREKTRVIVASGGGKVGNLLLVFHFSMAAKPGGGNVGISRLLARFPRGGGKSGKAAFGFPGFPRARHFHGPSSPLSEMPEVDLHFALPQQPRLGGIHLAGAFGVAVRQRLPLQFGQAHTRLEVLLAAPAIAVSPTASDSLRFCIGAAVCRARPGSPWQSHRAGEGSDTDSGADIKLLERRRHVRRRCVRSRSACESPRRSCLPPARCPGSGRPGSW